MLAVGSLIASAVVLFLIFKGGLFVYRTTDKRLEVVLLGIIPLVRVPFEDIEEIRKGSPRDFLHAKEFNYSPVNLRSRLFGQTVIVRRKKGILRAILITPRDVDGFVAAVQGKLSSR